MKVTIPKSMRGVVNPVVLTINLNDFDIDLFLPSLYFAVLGGGAPYGRRVNDPTALYTYISKLASHPALVGFSDHIGVRLLERLVRTSLVVLGRKGRAKTQEQVLALAPYTLLSSKSGLPKERTRQRNVDGFLYHALLSAQGGSRFDADSTLRSHFKRLFGRGVQLDSLPLIDGRYDGVASLDTMTRMSLAFLDGFEPTSVGKQVSKRQPRASCPAFSAALGNDVLTYLFTYSDSMPSAALIYNLQGLISLELFVYTLKVVHAINLLVDDPEHLPAAMQEDMEISSPEIYLDFTGARGSISYAMATHCVRRDVEAYQRFVTANILLRQLTNYIEQLRRIPTRAARINAILADAIDGPSYLQGLLKLAKDEEIGPQINHKAAGDEDEIRQQYSDESAEYQSASDLLDEVAGGTETPLERVTAILTYAQSKNVLGNYMQWYGTVGGLKKPHGILSGSSNTRQSWHYAPGNDLLAVLVQLAAIEGHAGAHTPGAKLGESARPQPIRLREFLDYLERRFGILIDRPPAPFTGADAAAAARENLRAMLGRLRQMGIFSDLSDDFTVQLLQPPYVDARPARQRS